MSVWFQTPSRNEHVDFTVSIFERPISLMGDFGRSTFDNELFTRPIQGLAWIPVMAACLTGFAVWNIYSDDRDSHRLTALSLWVVFVLVNAFYGGALTMFFTSAPSKPFEDGNQALNAWPKWKLVTNKVRDGQRRGRDGEG